MSVDDTGSEVLRKAAEPLTPGSKSEYRLRTSGEGTFTQSGLSIAGKISVVTISDSTWTALPATPLANRNAIAIQNQSGVQIKLQYDSGVAGYVGVIMSAGAERFYDITPSIIIYAKSSSGSVDLVVEELS